MKKASKAKAVRARNAAPKRKPSKKGAEYSSVVSDVQIVDLVKHSSTTYSVHVKARMVLPSDCSFAGRSAEVIHNSHSHGSGTPMVADTPADYYKTSQKIFFSDGAAGHAITGKATANWICTHQEALESLAVQLP